MYTYCFSSFCELIYNIILLRKFQ